MSSDDVTAAARDRTRCEGCRRPAPTAQVPNDPGPPFVVCEACKRRLEMRSLRPAEWFRLAAVHGWSSYALHDDFYDDDGRACAAEEPVLDADNHPYPTEATWSGSIDLALDVAYTKWTLPTQLVGVFAGAREPTLARIVVTVAARPNPCIASRAYEICALALGPVAEPWIRDEWKHASRTTLFALAQASAACLPPPEGLERVIAALRAMPDQERREAVTSLSWFRDERALDALEAFIQPPGDRQGGRTAAACGITWRRVCRWLETGRPLSHVALDALSSCIVHDTRVLELLRPELHDRPAFPELEARLVAHRSRDDVPRVRRAVDFILANADEL